MGPTPKPLAAPLRRGARLLIALAALVFFSGCAGHSARTKSARDALNKKDPRKALALYNEQLEVKSAKELPKELSGDNALLLMDRSLVLMQLADYQNSSRDLEVADKQVEMLDFTRSTADEIGKYLFSDDTGPYKAPPYEKLMINTMNMVNYLAKGDLNGARIEARRFSTMQKYLKESKSKSAALLGGGSYLAGFIFEKSRETQTAIRYYDEALQYGDFVSLHAPIIDLAGRTSYRTKRLKKIIDGAPAAVEAGDSSPADDEPADDEPAEASESADDSASAKEADPVEESEASADDSAEATEAATTNEATPTAPKDGELLVILSYGRVPAKIAKRIPVGLALTYAAGGISSANRAQANRFAAQGLVTWVNYPELKKPVSGYAKPTFKFGEEQLPLDLISIDKHVVDAWKEARALVITSAITRMIARVVAGEVASHAHKNPIIGLLLNLGTQATLSAADTPDTRSWATLPARMALGRMRLPAGEHKIVLFARGERVEKTVTIKPGGWAVLNLTVLR